MTRDFKVGDVVFLNSGSPALTVEDLGPTASTVGTPIILAGQVGVVWYDAGESKRDVYPAACLLAEAEARCEDESCVHCFPSDNCTRDGCPHCEKEDEERTFENN